MAQICVAWSWKSTSAVWTWPAVDQDADAAYICTCDRRTVEDAGDNRTSKFQKQVQMLPLAEGHYFTKLLFSFGIKFLKWCQHLLMIIGGLFSFFFPFIFKCQSQTLIAQSDRKPQLLITLQCDAVVLLYSSRTMKNMHRWFIVVVFF